ncbi:hypothetical protein C5748_18055 [Phyllobacterium phragmitis]|uniref:Uncharacterized protein n=1 Tax=Phyllobacterium phragmitis TaxID=2670329 RepID=A0A2S9ING3_9HYPH|nr:hypothetical protein [Phyllobacterium phragmitis]PRD42061.1 hypothetical protein C5748_18055 [Phyllobacterium phragmitis]
MSRCRWIIDREVPGGRYLVPGCWSRAVYGDNAECHCKGGAQTTAERLEGKIDKLIARMDRLEAGREALRQEKGGNE